MPEFDAVPGSEAEPADGSRRDLEQRLAFLEMTAEDALRLRALAPKFQLQMEAFVEAFYDHLFAFGETARFLQDPQRFGRLKQLQQAHFETLLEAHWDEAYVAGRRRVGHVHAEVGIEPQYFLGAYHKYLQFCFQAFDADRSSPSAPNADWISSLSKAIFFDIGLTLDAYFAQSTQDLRSALDMLWKVNQELRQFAQLTTHDLKTPLATVANLCDEALDEFGSSMPEEACKLVAAARQGAFRMSAMIDELLAAATEAPATELETSVAMGEVMAEAVERVRPVLKAKAIHLAAPATWPTVWGNQVRLREAFYNLLSNAAKFCDKPEGRIAIEVSDDGEECRFTISDNGPGIPRDELTRIFVPFHRLPVHRNRPGHGLGLYFTKNLIEAQGGRVWADSELGQGSRFHVTLKRHQPNRQAPAPVAENDRRP